MGLSSTGGGSMMAPSGILTPRRQLPAHVELVQPTLVASLPTDPESHPRELDRDYFSNSQLKIESCPEEWEIIEDSEAECCSGLVTSSPHHVAHDRWRGRPHHIACHH
jgi:hypothetical protein